jgi:hypothetical protein
MNSIDVQHMERVATSNESLVIELRRVADLLEKQQPTKRERFMATIVAIATIAGSITAVDIIRSWIF